MTTYQARPWGGNPVMVDYTPSSAVAAGDVVVRSSLVLICHTAIEANRKGALAIGGGLYKVPKPTGSSTAIAAGTKVYFDDADNNFKADSESGANKQAGYCYEAAGDNDTHFYMYHQPA